MVLLYSIAIFSHIYTQEVGVVFKSMVSELAQPLKICVCCSSHNEDKILCNNLSTQLKSLKHRYRLDVWFNNDVPAGSVVQEEFVNHLTSADVILLLISPDFLADDHLYPLIGQALKQRTEVNVEVLPIILRPSNWESTQLKDISVLPENREPITLWESRDNAFLNVIQNIDRIIQKRSTPNLFSAPTLHTSLSHGTKGKPFVDLEALLPTRELWTNGSEMTINRVRYCICHTEAPQWAKDGSALRQQAKARQLDEDHKVWLKQIRTFRSGASEAYTWEKALEKEARLLAELEQEQVRFPFPRRLDLCSTSHEKTLVYVAFSGTSLADTFGNGDRPVDPHLIRRLLRCIPSLCFMLQALHKKGLAHRMLTPATILLMKGQGATVQDVGLATLPPRRGEGPDLYRAPEQVRLIPGAAKLNSAIDMYQLGALLYHMLTGHLPQVLFSGEKIIPPSEWSPAIPQQLDGLLLQAVHFNPAERCRIGTFARTLEKMSRHA